jgi:hypothetical protein
MSGLLINYIKLLVESVADNEAKYADIITAKNQEMQQPKFYGDELNYIISELSKTDDSSDMEDILTLNGYSLLGQGAFRNVYSRADVDFVIKLNSDYQDSSNQIEYNTYFGNDQHEDINVINTDEKYYDVSIFPKLYGYDKKHGEWIIFEKVNTFDEMKLPITKFFPLFKKQIYDIYDSFRYALNFPEPDRFFSIHRKIDQEFYLFFIQIINEFLHDVDFNNPVLVKKVWKEMVIRFLKHICPYSWENPMRFESILKQEITRKGIDFNIPADISYILHRLQGTNVSDLHEGNFGYRDIKDPNRPWESFVMIDYAL